MRNLALLFLLLSLPSASTPTFAQQNVQLLQLDPNGDLAQQLQTIPKFKPYFDLKGYQFQTFDTKQFSVEDLGAGDLLYKNVIADIRSKDPGLKSFIDDEYDGNFDKAKQTLATMGPWEIPIATVLTQRSQLEEEISTLTDIEQARAKYINSLVLDRANGCLACLGTVQFPTIVPASIVSVVGRTKIDPLTLTGPAKDLYEVSANTELTQLVQGAIASIVGQGGGHRPIKFAPVEKSSIGRAFAISFRVLIHSQDWRTDDNGWDRFEVTAGYVANALVPAGVLDVLVVVDDYQRIGGSNGEASFQSQTDATIDADTRKARETSFASQIYAELSQSITAATIVAAADVSAAWPVVNIGKICP